MGLLTYRPEAEDPTEDTICAKDLPDMFTDRTLIFGDNRDFTKFHVYLKGGLIHRVIYTSSYNGDRAVKYDSRDWWYAELLVPERAYPESTDEDFYNLLVERAVDVRFLSYEPTSAEIRKAQHNGFQGVHEFDMKESSS